MPAKKIATSSSANRFNPTADWWRPRLSVTGEKVRRVIAIIYLEDLERDGHTYYDLLGYIDARKIKAVVSPIHDRDTFSQTDVLDWCARHIDPETGDLDVQYVDTAPYVGKPKKPHVHIGIMYSQQMKVDYYSELFRGFVHIRPSMWDRMEDYEAFVLYLAHLRSPEKAQYSPFNIHSFGGADLSVLSKQDTTEALSDWAELTRFAKKKKIGSFHKLVDEALESGDFGWMRCVKANSALFAQYFQSMNNERYWRRRVKEEGESIDPELLGKIIELIDESKEAKSIAEKL